jgi:hypothetical protein
MYKEWSYLRKAEKIGSKEIKIPLEPIVWAPSGKSIS